MFVTLTSFEPLQPLHSVPQDQMQAYNEMLRVSPQKRRNFTRRTRFLSFCGVVGLFVSSCFFYSLWVGYLAQDRILANSNGAADSLYPSFNDTSVPLRYRPHTYDVLAAYGDGMTGAAPIHSRGAKMIASSLRWAAQPAASCNRARDNLVSIHGKMIQNISGRNARLKVYTSNDRKMWGKTSRTGPASLDRPVVLPPDAVAAEVVVKHLIPFMDNRQVVYTLPSDAIKPDPTHTVADDDEGVRHVIVMVVDAVSRANFNRQLPAVNKRLQAVETTPNPTIHSFQFPFFHSVGVNSRPNQFALFNGQTYRPNLPPSPFIWEDLRHHGWTTAVISQTCVDLGNVWPSYNNLSRWDVAMTGIACDETYSSVIHSPRQGPVCRGGRKSISDMTESAMKIVNLASDAGRKSFVLMDVLEAHNSKGLHYVSRLDDAIIDIIDFVEDRADTALFILSDHGMHYGPIMLTGQGMRETTNPYLNVILPTVWTEGHNESVAALGANAGVLTSTLDVYSTLADVTGLGPSAAMYSPFHTLTAAQPSTRDCEAAGVPDVWCSMAPGPVTVINPASAIAAEATTEALFELNALTDDHRDVCGIHRLGRLYEMTRRPLPGGGREDRLSLTTKPFRFFYFITLSYNTNGKRVGFGYNHIMGDASVTECTPEGVSDEVCSCSPGALPWIIDLVRDY